MKPDRGVCGPLSHPVKLAHRNLAHSLAVQITMRIALLPNPIESSNQEKPKMSDYTSRFQELRENALVKSKQLSLSARGFVLAIWALRFFPVYRQSCADEETHRETELYFILGQILDAYVDCKAVSENDIRKWRESIGNLASHGEHHQIAPHVCILIDISADILQQINCPPYASKFGLEYVCGDLVGLIVEFVASHGIGILDPGNMSRDLTEYFYKFVVSSADFQSEFKLLIGMMDSACVVLSNDDQREVFLRIRNNIETIPWPYQFQVQ